MGIFSADEIVTSSSSTTEQKLSAGALCVLAFALLAFLVFKMFSAFNKAQVQQITRRETQLQSLANVSVA